MSASRSVKNLIRYPAELLASKYGQHRRQSRDPRLWIMMYHRILPRNDPRYHLEEPGMIVEPATFQMHLQILKEEFTLISLREWVDRKICNRPLPAKACAITFDDGWLDNHDYAFPLLDKASVPATIFAVSNMVGTHDIFWPNRVVRLLQQPSHIRDSIPWLKELSGNRPANAEFSAQAIYSLKKYSDHDLLQLIESTEKTLGVQPAATPSLMNWQQLRKISDNDLFDVGSHTCHHFRLSTGLDPGILQREVTESKKFLENKLDKPVVLFCYPNGDYSDDALRVVSQHYKAAVTTESGVNYSSNADLLKLKRFGVHQDISHNRRKLLASLADWP